ncbi:hypothetical protein H6G80_06965 [Nostoc sp. FACHB-87]|uniref:hypothetical protein n=1 Tax=Nostocaceae TaxID=1162 RepID=UPI0016827366|nr:MULTISPECIES: hypothetical protein [Nostocaceae]MBD2453815.1 hypothetical protein [Nostoc sp. FACHB-87]MBD2475937.1 hypothetical protein [Anabaena sp. FACHB-83]
MTDFDTMTVIDCDQEPINIPGYIQPFGVLLALELPHLKILQASENTSEFFGISAADLIGNNLTLLFASKQVQSIIDALQQEVLPFVHLLELKSELSQFLGENAPNFFLATIQRSQNILALRE